MSAYCAFRVIVLVSIIGFCQAKTEETSKNIVPDAVSKAIDPASASTDDNDAINRKKKSATTTLCVEIRPSGPYQRPFQICEPAENKPYAPAPSSYYPGPSYEEAKPAVSTKPAATYDAPSKSYTVKPTAAPGYASSKPYAAHSPSSYSSVSYRSDDGTEEMEGGSEEDEHFGDEVEHLMRSVGQEPYGPPVQYLAPSLKHKQKKSHNGLVITCQPSLAGYAATLPSYPSSSYGVPSYGGYRASTARSYGNRYERPAPQKAPQYASQYGPAPSYKSPAPVYKPQPSYSSYKTPQSSYIPSYNAPAYRPAPSYSPSYAPPAYKPLPSPPAYKPAYAPASAPVYKSDYAPAPVPASAPAYPQSYSVPPSHPVPIPYGYPASPSYGPPLPPPPQEVYAPVPKPHPQPAYAVPGTYRASEDHQEEVTTEISKDEKEQHTLRMMKVAAESRAVLRKNHEDDSSKGSDPTWKPSEKVGSEVEMKESWNHRDAEKEEEMNEVAAPI